MKLLKLCVLLFCLCSWSNVYAQLRDYSGMVTEDDGTPLIGVTVLVKNTTNGTVTDIDGKLPYRHNRVIISSFPMWAMKRLKYN